MNPIRILINIVFLIGTIALFKFIGLKGLIGLTVGIGGTTILFLSKNTYLMMICKMVDAHYFVEELADGDVLEKERQPKKSKKRE